MHRKDGGQIFILDRESGAVKIPPLKIFVRNGDLTRASHKYRQSLGNESA